MTFELEKQHYVQHGFVIVRQLLGNEDFADLKENLDRYIRDVVPRLPDADAFYQDRSRPETLKQMQRMGGDAFFREYVNHPKWKALAEALIGEPASAAQPEWFNKPPGTRHVTLPHQDNYYFCLQPANVLTMWMALDPVSAFKAGQNRVSFQARPGAVAKAQIRAVEAYVKYKSGTSQPGAP